MEYFKLLNLEKEPFSNSPDPDYFFKSRQHKECLQKLELSLRLRRGLNVVIGEVGTGKTTLCRQMIKKFSRDEEFETHLILDPHMADPAMFLRGLARMFEREPDVPTGEWADYKEFIKQYLYKRGVEENRVVVLIVDEGQKIPAPILEILRELLNYETNEFKLLQIVIFAQGEFEPILEKHANFADRINLLHVLGPLGFKDTRLMIDYRLQKAGAEGSLSSLLSFLATVAIYRATGGYPRKIVNLCHRIMLAMIVKNRKKAGWRLVRSCVNRVSARTSGRWPKAFGALLVVVSIVGIAYTAFTPEKAIVTRDPVPDKVFQVRTESVPAGPLPSVENGSAPPAPTSARVPVEVQARPQTGTETAAKPTEGPPTIANDPAGKAALATEIQPVEGSVDAEPVAAVVRDLPQTLGVIRVQRDETLSWLMYKVYGEYRNVKRRAIEAANPELKNPDNIFRGQAIVFPALANEGPPAPEHRTWVRVGSRETVSEALGIIRQKTTAATPLRIMPYWHRDQGLRFDILFTRCFSSQDKAARYLANQPESVWAKSEIISGWEKGAVVYAIQCPRMN